MEHIVLGSFRMFQIIYLVNISLQGGYLISFSVTLLELVRNTMVV